MERIQSWGKPWVGNNVEFRIGAYKSQLLISLTKLYFKIYGGEDCESDHFTRPMSYYHPLFSISINVGGFFTVEHFSKIVIEKTIF